jgi:GNAT superfamily N-acetyltransferase
MDYAIVVASAGDAATIAALHAESWRSAYRGLYRDEFLDGPVFEERLWFWNGRLAAPHPERRRVLLAKAATELVGFACVLLDDDPAWSPLLDNLHIKPAYKGQGIGARLLTASREWIARVAPGQPMHLWVMEGNTAARHFYDRQGGTVAERSTIEYGPGAGRGVFRYVFAPLAARC